MDLSIQNKTWIFNVDKWSKWLQNELIPSECWTKPSTQGLTVYLPNSCLGQWSWTQPCRQVLKITSTPALGVAPWHPQKVSAPAGLPSSGCWAGLGAQAGGAEPRLGALARGEGFRKKKNNFPGLSYAGLGFLLTFVDHILLFRVTQLSLLKCYVYFAESARHPGLSRRGLDVYEPELCLIQRRKIRIVLNLFSSSAFELRMW